MTNDSIARKLVEMIDRSDTNCMLDLRCGGDGDLGEIAIELVTKLLDEGRISIQFN